MANCEFCRKEFIPIKHHRKFSRFCSRPCGIRYRAEKWKLDPRSKEITYTGKKIKARIRSLCESCGEGITSKASKLCIKCYRTKIWKSRGSKTIAEVIKKTDYKGSHKYQSIRNHASIIMEICNIEKKCKACSYDKHVVICHIKAISSFSKETTLSEVNHPTNLVYLCPNCHWEMDNGLFSL